MGRDFVNEGVGEEVNYRDAAFKILILGLSCELYLTWRKSGAPDGNNVV